jgi:hypothetical protein
VSPPGPLFSLSLSPGCRWGPADITPVIEGQTVSAAATRLNVGGSDLTARLRSLMGEQLTPAQWKELKHACISVSPTRLDAQVRPRSDSSGGDEP